MYWPGDAHEFRVVFVGGGQRAAHPPGRPVSANVTREVRHSSRPSIAPPTQPVLTRQTA
jgi:hypothetical protein